MPLVPRPIVRKIASRYIAGETLDDAVRAVKQLNSQGACATLDVLGEHVHSRDDAKRAVRDALEVFDAIAKHKLDSNVSIKLTQFGLKIDSDFCVENVRELVVAARERGNYLRIDMEDSGCTDATLAVYRTLRSEGFTNVGACLQAYLRRSEADMRDLAKINVNLRLCTGIYVDPEAIAFKGYDEINQNFLKLIRIMFESHCYIGIATHDDPVVDGAKQLIRELDLKKTDYEFQMLLGVRTALRHKLVAEGHKLRVYVPFGRDWYAYSSRRFKENPEIAGYVFKSLFSKNSQ
jgi:proline dehydrogenase